MVMSRKFVVRHRVSVSHFREEQLLSSETNEDHSLLDGEVGFQIIRMSSI